MKRHLIIQTAFIGDAVLVSSVLETIHRDCPHDQIDLMVRKGNESIYEGHPFIGRLYVWDKALKYKSLSAILREVRRVKYDKLINLQRFGATGLMSVLSGAKEIRGFDKNPLSRFFTHAQKHIIGDGTHEIDRNHTLIRDFTGERPAKPRLYPSGSDREKVKSFRSEPYVCIAPTSVWFTKQFPADKWAAFIDQLNGKYRVYLIGAPSDHEDCENLIAASKTDNVHNLCGRLSLLQSAELMRHAVMNYVNDSAPMHLCSAVNAPVTAVYCSTVPEFGFGPLSDRSFVVETHKDLSCRPCGLHGRSKCPLGHFECAHSISVERLLEPLP